MFALLISLLNFLLPTGQGIGPNKASLPPPPSGFMPHQRDVTAFAYSWLCMPTAMRLQTAGIDCLTPVKPEVRVHSETCSNQRLPGPFPASGVPANLGHCLARHLCSVNLPMVLGSRYMSPSLCLSVTMSKYPFCKGHRS